MKIWKHLIRILRHKFWVAKYCFKLGLYWRGITHDMSKFSPVEFLESVKYYNGNSSPIVECKRINGYSKAWMHHRGHNDHHYEYWIDKLDEGGVPLIIPKEAALELICDYIGASHAYNDKKFTFNGEHSWWMVKSSEPMRMHPAIKNFISRVLIDLDIAESKTNTKIAENIFFNRKTIEKYYDVCVDEHKRRI